MSTVKPPIQTLSSADRAAPHLTSAAAPPALRLMLALEDFEAPARRYIPRPIYGYVSGGVERNVTLNWNRSAFDDLALVPRMLVNVSQRSQKTELFGRVYDSPFGIAPMGGTSLAAFQGDLALATAAASRNVPMILSGASLTPLEQVRSASPGHSWFQAYLPGEEQAITELVERVARAGYDTLVLTVDIPVGANRENNVRNGYNAPLRPNLRLALQCLARPRWLVGTALRTYFTQGMPHFENMGKRTPLVSRTAVRERANRDHLNWAHVALMRRLWPGRLVIKGILDKADAKLAREHGADGIIVSNHGGRQLDSASSPLRVLPGIVELAGDMTVMMDSGVRRGTDVLKALALGAKFVFIGRPMLYAAAVAGETGVRHAIKLLQDEIDRDMAMLGANTIAEMSRERLMDARGFDGLGR
ncbi:MAG: FMN-dependent dehydrogenase family protein 2 [Proteobacteria bacterium]|nr:FMN-dependent dehydrogenase family protein 2 [Pseudomonadota bacterium]RPJ48084.1 MAG: alpha-hydroxy-acid oxidizing protein [Betaproteobacteria bacterium]